MPLATNNHDSSSGIAKSIGQYYFDSKDLGHVEAEKITRFYKVPSSRFEKEEDVIKHYRYELIEKIAEGGFATVYKAFHLDIKINVACKKIDLTRSKSQQNLDKSKVEDLKNELMILKKLHNPYCVKLYSHFVINTDLFIFMKLANNGPMNRYVRKRGPLTECESQVFFGQILVGINYMHSLNIAHRDIKLENILLLQHPNGKLTILITDFGLSRLIHVDDNGRITLSSTYCGTISYMPPEILEEKPYNAFLADIWSLGITLYVMLNNDAPFDDRDTMRQICRQKNCDWKLSDRMVQEPSNGLVSVLRMMLEPHVGIRITMPQLITHPWVSKEFCYAKTYFDKFKKIKKIDKNIIDYQKHTK